jgi:hypothetical protein
MDSCLVAATFPMAWAWLVNDGLLPASITVPGLGVDATALPAPAIKAATVKAPAAAAVSPANLDMRIPSLRVVDAMTVMSVESMII